MAGKRKKTGFWWYVLFVLYCLLMLWLLFGQRWGTELYRQHLAENMNLIPFATLRRYWELLQGGDGSLVRHAFINLAGNVIMFVPLGFFLPKLFPGVRKFYENFLLCAGLIATVEAIQYLTLLGSCDVDDLILNLVGISLGHLLYRCTRR